MRKHTTAIVFVVFILAVIGSYVVNNQESSKRDSIQHTQIVQTCERGSARIALIANGQFVLARRVGARGNPGDKQSSEEYAATGAALLDTIPAPLAMTGSPVVAEANPVYGADGKTIIRYRLTRRAMDLQAAGCKRVNK